MDITKCTNEECNIKKQCYRHTAPCSFKQSYCHFHQNEDGSCGYFWPRVNHEIKRYRDESNK